MINLRSPDFRINLTTGILGMAYHLSRDYDLAILVLGSEESLSGLPSHGSLAFWILKNKVRDIVSEDYLLAQQEGFGKIFAQPFGSDRLLTIHKEDLQGLYLFAKEVLGKAKVA